MVTGKFLSLVCFLMLVFCLAGCGSSSHKMPVTLAVSPQPAYVGSGQSMQFSATSAATWAVSSATAGASAGTIDAQGNFTAPTVTQNTTVTVTATSTSDSTVTAPSTVFIIAPGIVAATANAQVALYTISVPDGLSAFIQFSTDTSFGLSTWSVAAPSGGGPVPILVAGMKGNTAYHMRAAFQPTGTTTTVFSDADHTFTTSAYPVANIPSLTVTTTSGENPQAGIELLSLINASSSTKLAALATDLSGNVIWGYDPGASIPAGANTNPIKLLPNGHFLIVYTVGPGGTVADSVVQEVDLAGQIIWEMTPSQLNAKLAAAACPGCNVTVLGNHHDVAILPNGHLIFLGSVRKTLTVPNFSPNPVSVLGDVIIDLDENRNPVWLWNSFDWLDVNRHPMLFPDWTHSNAIIYSPDDKALMLSIRHQAWVIKINYNDGAGDGSIKWTLGYQGDFALQSGTTNALDPVDWFNAQHDANIISTTTSGTLDVLLFDNGNQRVLQSNPLVLCGASGAAPCESRVPVIHLDENAKTADITWLDKLAPIFSNFGGSARQLNNGNIEFDACSTPSSSAPVHASIFEVTKTTPPQVVWQMQVTGQFAYRAIRTPSLYPGVQW